MKLESHQANFVQIESALKNRILKLAATITFLSSACVVAGCAGSKVLKEPLPLVTSQSPATASDECLVATLDWVIVRDGPGSWATNVDWDEYLIRIDNLSGDSSRITRITVLDSLGTRIDPGETRRQLVKGSKETLRRYKGRGLTVRAGASAGVIIAAGAATGAAVASVGAAAIYTSGAMAGAALGGLVLAPVLAVGGVWRGMNNSRVSEQIVSRQTSLPLELRRHGETAIDIFFPLTPSPRQIELTYADSRGEHMLIIDTRSELEGLHLVRTRE